MEVSRDDNDKESHRSRNFVVIALTCTTIEFRCNLLVIPRAMAEVDGLDQAGLTEWENIQDREGSQWCRAEATT